MPTTVEKFAIFEGQPQYGEIDIAFENSPQSDTLRLTLEGYRDRFRSAPPLRMQGYRDGSWVWSANAFSHPGLLAGARSTSGKRLQEKSYVTIRALTAGESMVNAPDIIIKAVDIADLQWMLNIVSLNVPGVEDLDAQIHCLFRPIYRGRFGDRPPVQSGIPLRPTASV